MSETKPSQTGRFKKPNNRPWYAAPKILPILIPAFFTCLSAVLVAFIVNLFNPELVKTILEIVENQPTPTVIFTQVSSPPTLTLTDTPTSFSTLTPAIVQAATLTETPVPPGPEISCPWIPYLKDVPTSSLSSNNCLNDLKGVGISGDEKQISFFVAGRSLGMYGVCRSISKNDKFNFRVVLQDNIDAARFLVTIGPEPVPGKKSSRGFRIQPEIPLHMEKEIWVKFIEYTSDGYPKDIDEIKAIRNWKYLKTWNFDFVSQFSGAQVNISMNNKALSEQWLLNSPSRYLCFAYEAMTTAAESAQLDVHIQFP
jgi:hypothetical protein